MIINWKGGGMLMVPVVDAKTGLGRSGKIAGDKLVRFMPGYNEVPSDVWSYLKPHVANHIDKGNLTEVGKNEKDENGKPITADTPIGGFRSKAALQIIEETFNVATLKYWLQTCGSDDLERAINKQLEKIAYGGKKKSDVEEMLKAGL